jgi:hypothetical protein
MTTVTKEKEKPIICNCKECGNQWEWPQPVPMDMLAWIVAAKAVHCPKCNCGSGWITFDFGSDRSIGIAHDPV